MKNESLLRAYVRSSLHEGMLGTAGHVVLDLAGLIPGVGEPFDAANAVWYAKEGDYISALLSLISCIPEVGDVIGKGGKLALWASKLGKAGEAAAHAGSAAVKLGNLVKKNQGKIQKVLNVAKSNEALAPHIGKINDELGKLLSQGNKTSNNEVQQKST